MILVGTKQVLLLFLENLNGKQKTIESNISHSNISFLKTLIYKDKNNTLETTIYRKPIDRSLKNSIRYSQALSIKIICSTLTEYKKHSGILKQKFI